MSEYFNPYSDQNIFGFFSVFFSRIWAFFTGDLSFDGLVSDEIQILVLSCVALSGALVGTFLVLKRQTMLANALSHTILLGIVIAYLVCGSLTVVTLMIAALLTGLATSFLTDFLTRVIHLQEDASIGLIFSIFFALGITLLTLYSRNVHIGTELVMGNADALQKGDLKIVGTVLGVNAVLFFLFYYGLKITTFDGSLARAFGFSPLFYNYLIMIMTSTTAIAAFRAVGVLMILAFFVFPPLTARLLTNRLGPMIWIAMGIAVLASLFGVAISRHILTFFEIGLSTGGIVVTVLGIFYGFTLVLVRLIDISFFSRYHACSNLSEKHP